MSIQKTDKTDFKTKNIITPKNGKFIENITIIREWKVFSRNGTGTTVYWHGKEKHFLTRSLHQINWSIIASYVKA